MTILQIAIFLKEKIRPFLIYKKFKMGSIVVAYNFLLTYIHTFRIFQVQRTRVLLSLLELIPFTHPLQQQQKMDRVPLKKMGQKMKKKKSSSKKRS